MERETGIEPATNSLEGCDSTTELLPPMGVTASPRSPHPRRYAKRNGETSEGGGLSHQPSSPDAPTLNAPAQEGWWGGEGSNLRSH